MWAETPRRFDVTPQGRLRRSKDERTLHLMEKVQPGFGSQNWAFGGFELRKDASQAAVEELIRAE